MKNLNELKELPEFIIDLATGEKVYKPSEESTRKWLEGMDEYYQKFIKLYNDGHFGDLVIDFNNMTINGKDIMSDL